MHDTVLKLVSLVPSVLFLFFLGFFMPKLIRQDTFFGVRIPPDRLQTPSVRAIAVGYRKAYLWLAGPMALGLLVWIFWAPPRFEKPWLFSGLFFGFIFIHLVPYLRARHQALRLKEAEGWLEEVSQAVVVDTSFRKTPHLVRAAWFWIPVVLILVDVIIALRAYPHLPDRIPVHFDALGRPDRWQKTTPWSLLAVPLLLAWTTGLMYVAYWVIGSAKQELMSSDPEGTLRVQDALRRMWSAFIVGLNIGICGLISLFYWHSLGVIRLSPHVFLGLSVGFTGGLLGVTGLWIYRTARMRKIRSPVRPGVIDRNDDRYWKWGLFYYNPDDPALFVEKRFGIGWTNNFANWKANLILLGILLSSLLVGWLVSR